MKLPLVDVKAIDWNSVWKARRAMRASPARDAHFWDGRAPSFAKAASETDYAERLLEIIKPEASWTVLDMGCGSGVLAVPLARLVSAVTAVDLSAEMLSVAAARCAEEGISNVSFVKGRWEDDWDSLGIGPHDAAIASRSMVVDDLRGAILKLDGVARKRAAIVTVVGDGPYDRRLFEAVGRPLDIGPDYIYNYNMLYQMGILAHVAFVEERRARTYRSLEEAFASTDWVFDRLTPAEADKLRAYFKENLIPDGGSWRLPYDLIIRWAVMWWDKPSLSGRDAVGTLR